MKKTFNLFLYFKYNHGTPLAKQTLEATLENLNYSMKTDEVGRVPLQFTENDLNKTLKIDAFEMIDFQTGYPTHKLEFTVGHWLELSKKFSHSSILSNTITIIVIPKPVIIELDKQHHLNTAQIEYFKHNGSNALLFIHGFNSALGHYGFYPETYNIKRDFAISEPQFKDPNEKKIRYFIDFKASRYPRTIRYNLNNPIELLDTFKLLSSQIAEKYPKNHQYFARYHAEMNPEGVGEEEIALNGIEAHHWFGAMEYNFNVAAGFCGKDYNQYTRIIGIHWPGNVGLLNFSQAEEIANQKATALSHLILQLTENNIQVNVVAHSLGCRLLLRCMDAFENIDIINHAILWQAAMPKQALTQHEKALRAAKKITVLFSRNDGVLQGLYCGHQLPKYPTSALGFSGPKSDSLITELESKGKLLLVDQTHVLKGHSYIKIPTVALMDQIYREYIIGGRHGIQQFGQWKDCVRHSREGGNL